MDIVSCVQDLRTLALDIAGRLGRWIGWQEAVVPYCRKRIASVAGQSRIRVRGGPSRLEGRRSELLVITTAAACNSVTVNLPPTVRAVLAQGNELDKVAKLKLRQRFRDYRLPTT